MAGRFLFQKLASRMSRSTSLLGAHAAAPVTRRPLEGGVRTLNNSSCGPVAHAHTVVLNNSGILGYPARYLSTLPCTRAASFKSSPSKVLPPVITGRTKPALVDCVRAKRNFSSSSPAKDTTSLEQKMTPHEAELRARWDAELAAWNAKKDADAAAFSRFIAIIGSSWGLIFLSWIYMPDSGSSRHRTSSCKGQSRSHCCSSCCKCQTGSSKSNC